MAEELTPVFESFIERRVREAREAGEFDGLPGEGKPLLLRHVDDPDWWVKSKIEDENLGPELRDLARQRYASR
jgi:hypothetical protein